jgi:MFS family permease
MNVLEARVVLRDRTLLDVVDLSLRFLVRNGWAYAKVALVALAAPLLLTGWVASEAGWGWAWVLAMALAPLAAAPFTSLASRLLFEEKVASREAVRAALGSGFRLIGVRIAELFALLAGLSMFVLPAAWFLGFFAFTNEVVVLERATVGASLGRLQRLLAGQSGEVIMAGLFLTLLHLAAVFLGDLVGRAVLEELLQISPPPSLLDAHGSALGLASFFAFVPFGATCRFLVYINVRTRTEGWDVQTRFAALAAREAAS